jgi:hypothetical protein
MKEESFLLSEPQVEAHKPTKIKFKRDLDTFVLLLDATFFQYRQ